MNLRPATIADASLLYGWRNDPETRAASRNTGAIDRDDYNRWLEATLANPRRKLLIAEVDGAPVGTVRCDENDAAIGLSCTVAPEARGRGVATAMVKSVAESIAGPLCAEVRVGNVASVRVAEAAGLSFDREARGILYFVRRTDR